MEGDHRPRLAAPSLPLWSRHEHLNREPGERRALFKKIKRMNEMAGQSRAVCAFLDMGVMIQNTPDHAGTRT
ncbi:MULTISPECIES: hypothetical protein [Pseudoxanthomonas]|jgi:hypothetical protein|uniref:Uncharacterized protein n=1 Tax=Pseudoxanthomonas winnipegensis TaxID=2480810 RepID=A0A4Q8L8A3_9GAMM|nr:MULTISPECIES: hypothetical protein [Pseudoxanthomonas]TAA24317.1 hypothetical protein EA660_11290 [Pseudoxanthomonas winnipegensis]TMN17712.1 hypothetical protein FF950_16465 [Pseudoxanthomonas sp. X-1]UAY75854.1 hypothetical protein LAJ50_06330 [Pseudoxanthomonas sp. X-1]